jgi:1-acyl-sn-glycerol-3-phosphate acyltransferase
MSRIVSFTRYAKNRITSIRKPASPNQGETRPKRKPVSFLLGRLRRRLRRTVKEIAGNLMLFISALIFRVEINGRKNFNYSPGTVMACTHKSSTDIPVVIPRLYLWKFPRRMKQFHSIYEMTREDLFEDGFFINFVPAWNKYRRFLTKINIGWYFDFLQARPIKTPDEQSASQLLHEAKRIYGNLPAVKILARDFRVRIFGDSADSPHLKISDAILKADLTLLKEFFTPEMFAEPYAAETRKRHRETLIKQLREFTRLLERGETFFIHPEGEISLNGRYGKAKAALMRIVQNSRADITLLPVNVTYDFMDSIRPKAIVNIGEQVAKVNQLTKNELADLIDALLPALGSITMSGIASRSLMRLADTGQDLVRRFQLRDLIWEDLSQLRPFKIHIDTQIYTRQSFEQRFDRFIAYCRSRTNIFLPTTDTPAEPLHYGDEWLKVNLPLLLREECSSTNDHPVRYCYNELCSVLEAHNLMPKPAHVLHNALKGVAPDKRNAV